MVAAYHSLGDPNLEGITGLPDEFSNSLLNVSNQNLVTILRYPHEVILDRVNCMASVCGASAELA